MENLAHAVEKGDYADLFRVIQSLNDRQRKAAANWFISQWKEHKTSSHPRDSVEPHPRWMRLLVGLAAVAPDAKKALSTPIPYGGWQYGAWSIERNWLEPVSPEAIAALAQAAIGRGAAWCTQYLMLVADAKKPRPMFVDVLLLIMQAHALPMPATPIIPRLWAGTFFLRLGGTRYSFGNQDHRTVPVFELSREHDGWTVSGSERVVASHIAAARTGRNLQAMLLAVLENREALKDVNRYAGQDEMDQIADVVSELVADGTIDASQLAQHSIAALSRGDAVSNQRLQARLLRSARPDAALVSTHAGVLVNLIASAAAPAAALAQELLQQADAVAPLSDALFVDASQMAFARKEKGLHAAQLSWAHARAARPATLASAIHGLTAALLCADYAVQSKAVAGIESAWPALDSATRAALAIQIEASQGIMDATLHQQLRSTCLGGADVAEPEKMQRADPVRTGMVKLPFEAVADLKHLPADVTRMIQFYQTERDALAYERLVGMVQDLLQAGDVNQARGLAPYVAPIAPFIMQLHKNYREMSYVAYARMTELQKALKDGRPQHFVSRPSWAHGAIAPAHLADRLALLAKSGKSALPVDLLTALLRTEPCDADTLLRLRAIGSAQALAAADFLDAGGSMQLTTRWLVVEGNAQTANKYASGCADWYKQKQPEVCVALHAVAKPPAIDGIPLDWSLGFEPADAPHTSEFDMVPDWITPMLPNNAEALAALHLWGFRRAGLEYGTDGGVSIAMKLSLYLAAHGPAGAALHLATLFAMSAKDARARLAGSDGMVVLLQQGRWQSELAAELLAECLRCGSVKAGRLAASLTQVYEAGELEAVWHLARAGIAAVLGMNPIPAVATDLLALGASTASALGAKEQIPELAGFVSAIKGKPNKLQMQAQRLYAYLTKE